MNTRIIGAATLAAWSAAAVAETSVVPPAPAAPPPSASASAVGPHPPHVHVGARSCTPDWPAEARAAGVHGRTTVRLSIDAAGKVQGSTVVTASGPTPEHRSLDDAVVAAFSRCEIDAARDAAGQPVAGDAVETWIWSRPDPADTRPGISTGKAANGRPVPFEFGALPPECRPAYPPAAIRAQVTGTTVLQFVFDATGKVLFIEVERPSGKTSAHQLLDVAARVIGKCGFQPPLDEGGTPRAGSIELSYRWSLD